MKKTICLLLGIFMLIGGSMAQTILERTSVGSEFKFVFLQNRITSVKNESNIVTVTEAQETRMSSDHAQMSLWVSIANQESQAVTVHMDINEETGSVSFYHSDASFTFNVDHWEMVIPASETRTVELVVSDQNDLRNAQMMYSLDKQYKMITISSATVIGTGQDERPALLAVYAESRQAKSRDAAMILPVQSLGSEYIAVTGNRLYKPSQFPEDQWVDVSGPSPDGNSGGPSEIAILAIEDITVQITVPDYVDDLEDHSSNPNSAIDRTLFYSAMDAANNTTNSRQLTRYLEAGQAIQLQSDFYDLTGTQISARKAYFSTSGSGGIEVSSDPGICAVFSGNMAAQISYDFWDESPAFDHVYEQMYPIETWGCEYYGVNTQNPYTDTKHKKDVYKIIAGYDNTRITEFDFGWNGTSISDDIELDKGEFLIVSKDKVILPGGSAVKDALGNTILTSLSYVASPANPGNDDFFFRVKADKSITVAQFTVSANNTGTSGTGQTNYQDPSMVLLSPTDQTLFDLQFVVMPKDASGTAQKIDHLLILTADNYSHIELNGTSLGSSWKQLEWGGLTGWKYKIVPLHNTTNDPETYSLNYDVNASGETGFLAYVYGNDDLEGYFYAAGINADIRRVFPDQTSRCLEINVNDELDADYLNGLNLLKAEGGDGGYIWSLIGVPDDVTMPPLSEVLDNPLDPNPTFKSTFKITKIGKYTFQCLVKREGDNSCDLPLEVTLIVPSCCDERHVSADYIPASTIISESVSWGDRILIDDYTTITIEPGAELTINNADVVFGQCARIVVEPGAIIRANNSVFRPCNAEIPWDGIYFESDALVAANNNSLFNECTFKYAVNAINIENGESVGIHNNLFLNNYTGVNVEGQPTTGSYSEYDKQISGNKFIVDNNIFNTAVPCALDNGEPIETLEHFGIRASNVEFTESITHNEFNNTMNGAENRVFVGILLNTASAKISQNSFTEMFHGIQVDNSISNIIGNTFELTDMGENKAQVDIRNSIVDTDIRSNEFTCWGDAENERAIYLSDCKNVSVVDNEVTGFFIGILSVDGWNTLISKNKILDVVKFGIYTDGIWGETGDEAMVISCNEIHMDMNRLDEASVGIACDNLKAGAKIVSNCIFDCMVSIFITRETFQLTVPSPIVANNFMYNYDWAGIYYYNVVSNTTGNKRAVRDNTYYSNSSAYDIASNRSETFHVEKSFGLFTVTPNVQIGNTANDDPRFSRASCGSQIFRLGIPNTQQPGPVDLGVNYSIEYYKCDNDYSSNLPGLTGNWELEITALATTDLDGVPFGEGEYSAILHEAARHEMIEEAGAIYEASQASDLSEISKVRLSFHYYVVLHNFDQARDVLTRANQYPELHRWIRLNAIRLTYIQSGLKRSAISKADIATLKELAETLDYVGSGATTFLNTLSFGTKLKYIATTDVEQPETLGRMSTISNRIEVYPNPSKTTIDIQFSFESSEIAEMTIVDIYGKEVDWMKPSYISGTLNLDISQWESGFYFVNVTLENGELHSQKFVKI